MDDKQAPDDTAKAVWNGVAGQNWVEAQGLLDDMFRGFEERLVADCVEQGARRVLDVGCGTGATTLAIARALGPQGGRCTGIDISEPMIALARERAGTDRDAVLFICDDAEDHPLPEARYDRIVSRFGVMFFADPVRAFANLRRAAVPGGRLGVIAWRGPEDNPVMTLAARAAAPFLEEAGEAAPAPTGQFAFADGAHVRTILEAAGWSDIAIEPLDIDCALPEAALDTWLTRLGPLGRILPGLDADRRDAILAALQEAYAPHIRDGAVRFRAACWSIGGENA